MHNHLNILPGKIERICETCGKSFTIKRARFLAGRGKFCSKACYNATGYGNGHTPQPIHERFWRYVHKTETCWLWIGSRDRRGYGRLNVEQQERHIPLLAHRISWELHYGPIPDGMDILHRCDNPPCINPSHLFLGEPLDNVTDMIQKDRNLYGERCPWAKLTEVQVLEIRRRYSIGNVSQYQLARDFGVSRGTICDIVRRKKWSHLS